MRSFTITTCRRLTLAFCLISIVSVPLIGRLRTAEAVSATALTQAEANLARSRSDATAIQTGLGELASQGTPPKSLDEIYPQLARYIRAQSAVRLITIQSFAVGARQIDANGVQLRELSEPITVAGSVRRLRIQLKFRYESLAEMQTYLDGLPQYQTVLKGLVINKDSATAELLVLGV